VSNALRRARAQVWGSIPKAAQFRGQISLVCSIAADRDGRSTKAARRLLRGERSSRGVKTLLVWLLGGITRYRTHIWSTRYVYDGATWQFPTREETAAGPPPPVAAALDFWRMPEIITGPLLDNPRRVGKPLGVELATIYSARLGRDWRVL
jgi:hypothetical protein